MKRKTIILLIVVCMLLAALFSGCKTETSENATQGTKTGEASGDGTVEADSVQITWMHHFAEPGIQAWIDWVINKFEEENPGMTVVTEFVSGDTYTQMLKTKIASDDAPNIFDLFNLTGYTEFSEAGHLYDLSDLECIANIQPKLLLAAQVNGTQVGIPLDMNAYCVFYNKDIFEELGLSVPTTTTELNDVCDTLLESGIVPFAAGFQDQWCNSLFFNDFFEGYCIKDNFNYYTEKMSLESNFADDENFKKAFEAFYNTKNYWGDDPFGTNWDAALSMVANGEAAMIVNGTWAIDGISAKNPDVNVGCFGMPISENPDDVYITLIPGSGFCIHNTDDEAKLDASIKLYNIMYSEEAGDYYQTSAIKMSSIAGLSYDFSPALGDVNEYILAEQTINMSGIINLSSEYEDLLYKAVLDYSLREELDTDSLVDELDKGFSAVSD